MNLNNRLGSALAFGTVLIATALLAASCSQKVTGADSAFTKPEGKASDASHLVVWTAGENVARRIKDVPPLGVGPEDTFIENLVLRRYPVGTMLGMLFDGSVATAYQVLRRDVNGGLSPLLQYPLNPTRRWVDGNWEVFEFNDPAPPAAPDYVARGVVTGAVTGVSPISNEARYTIATPPAELVMSYPTDTTVSWDPIPGAAYYVAHIFKYRPLSGSEAVLSGIPAPIYRGFSRDYFLGLCTSPQVVGRNQPFQGTILTSRSIVPGAYVVRASAFDAAGQMIATTSGTYHAPIPLDANRLLTQFGIATGDAEYLLFSLGTVNLKKPKETEVAGNRKPFAVAYQIGNAR